MSDERERPDEEAPPDQEAMAAEWAKMAGIDPEGDEGGEQAEGAGDPVNDLDAEWAELIRNDALAQSEPSADVAAAEEQLLSQEEIDLLLGTSETQKERSNSVLDLLVNPKEVTYERLPMLEVVFDRLERIMTTSLRNFTSENVDINLENITAQRFADYLRSIPLPAMIAIFKAIEWDNFALLTIDSPLIYSVIDILLGGRRGTSPMRIEGRPYTTIEMRLVEKLARAVLRDLEVAFQPIVEVHFQFERMETNPRFAAIVRPDNACVVFNMRIHLEDRGGTMEFLFPYATLEPARDVLLQMFLGEKFGRDSIWEGHLSREIREAEVELAAVIEELTMPLRETLAFRVGTHLPLTVGPDSDLILRCGDVPLFRAKAGRRHNRVAVRIEDRIEGEEA